MDTKRMASLALLQVACGGLAIGLAALAADAIAGPTASTLAAIGAGCLAVAVVAEIGRRQRNRQRLELEARADASAMLGDIVEGMGAHTARRMTSADRALGAELRRAVERDAMALAFQPVVDLASGRIAGLEALVRWDHPDRGPIPPSDFLDIAELDGAIEPLGRWVLRHACEQVASWQAGGAVPRDLFVCVNVSQREIRAPGFVGAVEEALAWSGMQPSRLVVEVSETALSRRIAGIAEPLEALRALGVRVAIDDFGTGAMSLRGLPRFPVDALKIARQLAGAPDRDPAAATMCQAIVALGGALGIATVAEGIETEEHAERMRDLGCTYGQGFFFAQPLSVAQIDEGVEGLATDHRWRAERPAPPGAYRRHQPRLLDPIRQPTAA